MRPSDLLIRKEQPDDAAAIGQLTEEAFAASEFGHNGESELIRNLRVGSDGLLSLIAERDERAVGHVLFSPGTIQTKSGPLPSMGLAPLSVSPTFQHQGIGSVLVEDGIKLVFHAGYKVVAVIGHPEFYQRLGFESASRWNVTHGFDGIPQKYLQLRCASDWDSALLTDGRMLYHRAFGNQNSSAT